MEPPRMVKLDKAMACFGLNSWAGLGWDTASLKVMKYLPLITIKISTNPEIELLRYWLILNRADVHGEI